MITWSIPTSRIKIDRNRDNGICADQGHTKRKEKQINPHGTYVTTFELRSGDRIRMSGEKSLYIIQFPIRGQYSAVIAFRASTVSDNRSGRRFLAGGFTVYAYRTSYTRQKQFTRMDII